MVDLHRRDALALFSGALVARSSRVEANGFLGNELVFTTAQEAHGKSVSFNQNVFCCSPDGGRPRSFEQRAEIDSAFVARFQDVAFLSSEGRGYGLAPHEISVEAFGAKGDGTTNDQSAVQRAIDYAAEIGASTVHFEKAAYAIWAPHRTSDPSLKNTYDGLPIIVRHILTLAGRKSSRSSLIFRNFNGEEFDRSWQVVNGKVWRGGGIFLQGLDPASSERKVPASVTLTDLNLDGGCEMGRYFGWPARPSDGDGWDVTHKALWAEEDRIGGNWTILRCKVSRFRGELFYQGGSYHGAVVMRDVEFCSTNADILNPCGTNIDIEGGWFHDGNSGFEGWGGHAGRLVASRFENCRSIGMMQGGQAYTASHEKGAYTRPTAYELGVKPWLTIDVEVKNCGPVYIGSWVRGHITSTDSTIALSAAVFHFISDVNLNIVALSRNKVVPAALSLTGHYDSSPSFKDTSVRIIFPGQSSGFRTKIARYGDTSQVRVLES